MNGEAYLYPKYAHSNYFNKLMSELIWRNDKIKMFGKEYEQARRVAWHGDIGVSYKYSNILLEAKGWTKSLEEIKKKIKIDFGIQFNSVLVNLYRDGRDHMSYHQDNEKELGFEPIIFSISFGAARDFYFKHTKTGEVVKLNLCDGDLLVMQGDCQTYWKHSLPKRLKMNEPRLNLTFRTIY